jgi:hypothetical protein
MKVFAIGPAVLEGTPAAFLYAPDAAPELPLKHMIVPEDADAGHIAAMALYLSLGDDVTIFVHEDTEDMLGMSLCLKAASRGVKATTDTDGDIIVTSDDCEHVVKIHFQHLTSDLDNPPTGGDLLALANAMYDNLALA